ncbi:MAG: hypothetical protein P8Y80_05755 [Acidobacteriota bacterium]|jgi:hypothetical protein
MVRRKKNTGKRILEENSGNSGNSGHPLIPNDFQGFKRSDDS